MDLPPKTADSDTSPATEQPKREGERIAKMLARAGIASRREVERLIEAGRIRLNDEVITTPSTVLTSLRGITVDGEPVKSPEASRLYAFHKPAGLLTAERDPAGRATIYAALRNSLPPGSPRVMPVGRLDLNTEGLLLMTNDGELKRAMELPSSLVPRTYRARTFGPVTQEQLEELMIGVEIEGVRYGSINANMERSTGANQWIELTMTEGKNREVRRVLEHLGLQVSRLIRIAYGPFLLGDLPRGAAVEIPQVQLERFRKGLKLPEAGTTQQAYAVQAGPMADHGKPARAAKSASTEPRGNRTPGRRKPDPSRPDESAGRRNGPQGAPPSRRSDQSRSRPYGDRANSDYTPVERSDQSRSRPYADRAKSDYNPTERSGAGYAGADRSGTDRRSDQSRSRPYADRAKSDYNPTERSGAGYAGADRSGPDRRSDQSRSRPYVDRAKSDYNPAPRPTTDAGSDRAAPARSGAPRSYSPRGAIVDRPADGNSRYNGGGNNAGGRPGGDRRAGPGNPRGPKGPAGGRGKGPAGGRGKGSKP